MLFSCNGQQCQIKKEIHKNSLYGYEIGTVKGGATQSGLDDREFNKVSNRDLTCFR